MPKKPMKITLKYIGESSDGKRGRVMSKENDGYNDLVFDVLLDDCNSKFALKTMREVIRRCNAANPK